MKLNQKNIVDRGRYHHAQAMRSATVLMALFLVAMSPIAATAYVGPGAGITLIGALWAVIVAFVFMIGGLLLWPLRALLRWRKSSRAKGAVESR